MEVGTETQETILVVDRYRTRQAGEADRQGVLELSALHYGDKELGNPGFVDWLLHGSPAGKGLCFISEELGTGKIVGFAFHVPVYVKAGKLRGIGRMGCNAVVHPDCRRQGIYASMAKVADSSYKNVFFSYGFPKPAALIPHSKAGRVPVTTIPLLVRPLQIDQLTRTRIRKPLLRRLVNLGWGVLSRTIWRAKRVNPNRTSLRVTSPTHFDAKFDHFWERIADKYEIVVERTSSFLNWRFCGQSFRSYRILAAWDGLDLVGYAVTRHLDLEGIQSGLIMDLLVEPGKRGEKAGLLLIEEAARRFQKEGMQLAGCLMLPHTHEFKILKKAGFVNAPPRLAPQKFMLLTKSWSSKTPLDYLLKSDRWFISMANHDAI